MSAFFGSTATFSKYQPRPQSALIADSFVHVAPASSERKKPPWPWRRLRAPPRPPPAAARRSARRCGAARRSGHETVDHRVDAPRIARRDRDAACGRCPPSASPFVSCFHVVPPSVRLEDAAARAVRRRVRVPGRPPRIPEPGVDDAASSSDRSRLRRRRHHRS